MLFEPTPCMNGHSACISRVGHNHIYLFGVYTVFFAGISSKYAIYGVYIRFWPTLCISMQTDTHRCTLPCRTCHTHPMHKIKCKQTRTAARSPVAHTTHPTESSAKKHSPHAQNQVPKITHPCHSPIARATHTPHAQNQVQTNTHRCTLPCRTCHTPHAQNQVPKKTHPCTHSCGKCRKPHARNKLHKNTVWISTANKHAPLHAALLHLPHTRPMHRIKCKQTRTVARSLVARATHTPHAHNQVQTNTHRCTLPCRTCHTHTPCTKSSANKHALLHAPLSHVPHTHPMHITKCKQTRTAARSLVARATHTHHAQNQVQTNTHCCTLPCRTCHTRTPCT